MKKALSTIGIIILSLIIFMLSYDYQVKAEPNTFYEVYLDGDMIGVIRSKRELENYINDKNEEYKDKYDTNKIYSPNGLDIEKIYTYDGEVVDVEDVYEKILEEKAFTISGYQFSITTTTNEEKENSDSEEVTTTKKIYTTSEGIFELAVKNVIETFVGKDRYAAYKNKTQSIITTTGTYIDNIYLDNDISIKKVKIPVSETIYTNSQDLTKFLLFGTTDEQKKYTVQNGDTIEQVSFNNKISTQEFLISNPTFTSENSLLFAGQEVVIGITDPQIQVVVESSETNDIEKRYSTIVKYDSTMQKGYTQVTQKGVNGVERVSQTVKAVNGVTTYIIPQGSTMLKASTPQIVVYGQKVTQSVGTIGNWLWPVKTSYKISSYYGYRRNPFTGQREFHTGLDIYTGYGSPIYASNNGTVITSEFHWSYGNYIVINHNNGYYTLYAHMSKRKAKVGDIVSRGDVIGLIGMTGSATGPHVHLEVWRGGPPFSGTRLNPSTLKYYY